MPRKDISEQNGPGRGRPIGSRNKFPQLLRQLVLNAAMMSGFPTKKWIIEEALDDEGNTIWVEVTDEKTHEIKKDDKGNILYRKKMRRHEVLEWTGAMGAQGYLLFMAQEERNMFRDMLKLAQQQQENNGGGDGAEGLHIPTMEELRAEWIRRGLRAVDFDKMKTVTGIEAKQRVKLIEYDPNERRRNGSKQQKSSAATSATDPESEQWWPEEEAEAED